MDHVPPDANPDAQPGAATGGLGGGAASGAEPGPGLIDAPANVPDIPLGSEHAPGAPEADSSEPQIPRMGEGGGAPGAHDPAHATGAEPVTGADVAGGTAAPAVGAGRPVEAAYAKRRPAQQQQQRQPGAAADEAQSQQQQGVEGAGYPTADRDGRQDAGRDGPPLVAGPGEEDDIDEDLEEDDLDEDDLDEDDPEELQVGGDAPDPAALMAPSEPVPEDAPVDVSVIGDGHADKAAWNRERTQAPQPGYDDVVAGGTGDVQPEDPGYGGGAPNEQVDPDLPGLDTGDGRLDELAEDVEEDEEAHVEEQSGALDARAGRLGGRTAAPMIDEADHDPDLPEHRESYDEGVATEERLIAHPGEDSLMTLGELGDDDELEMETLNEQDDIAEDFENQRADMDDAASGNERSSGL